MCDASVPGDDQQSVTGKEVSEDVGIWEDRAEHERPGDDSATIHRVRSEQVFAAEDSFSDQRPGDAMCDGIHRSSLSDAHGTQHPNGRI